MNLIEEIIKSEKCIIITGSDYVTESNLDIILENIYKYFEEYKIVYKTINDYNQNDIYNLPNKYLISNYQSNNINKEIIKNSNKFIILKYKVNYVDIPTFLGYSANFVIELYKYDVIIHKNRFQNYSGIINIRDFIDSLSIKKSEIINLDELYYPF